MSSLIERYFWEARRALLKYAIPEFVWPKQVVLDGVAIPVRNTPYSFGAKYILKKGEYEVAERKLLAGIIKHGDVVFEMGGSIGVLTSIIAHMTGKEGRVFSVEASKKLTNYSKAWLEQKGNIRVLTGFAFPINSCDRTIRVNSFDESQGSLGGVVSFEATSAANENSHEDQSIYDVKTIADQFKVSPDVLVVDIEGSETILLEDYATLMSSIQYVLIELHPHMYGEEIKHKIIEKIERLGYQVASNEGNIYLFKQKPNLTGQS